MEEKKPYVLAKLSNRKGDLTKRWFVVFQAWNRDSGKLEKKQIFCPAKFSSVRERNAWGNDQCKQINELLVKGYGLGTPKEPAPASDTPPTVRALVNKSLAHKKAVLKKKSYASYSGILTAFLDWLAAHADRPISDLKQVHISNYQDYLLNRGLSTVSVNNKINVIATVFKHLETRGHIEKKPVSYHKLPTTEAYRNRAFSPEHREKLETVLLEHFPGLYLLTRIMYYQFIRPGEIINLKLWDILLDRNTITIPGGTAKNRKMDTLPLHPSLRPLLMEKKEYPGSFYICGKHLGTGQYKAAENAALNMHTDALKLAGLELEGYTLYSWKHTGVTAAYLAGMDIVRLQHLLRHKSVQTTEIYLKSLRLLVDRIELKNW